MTTSTIPVLSKPPTNISKEALDMCGANFCPAVEEPANKSGSVEDNFAVSKSSLYTLAGIYLACSLFSGIVISVLVDPLTRYGENERNESKEKLTGLQLLIATFRHMKKPYQVLIIPLTFWSGVEQGFFGADFTAVSHVSIHIIKLC